MKLEVYSITMEQVKDLISSAESDSVSDVELEMIVQAAKMSTPLLAGIYNGELLAVFGFVPQTLLSDTAHLWVWNSTLVNDHKLIFARTSKQVIDNMLNDYPTITGFCITTKAKNWLRWLGAEFLPSINQAQPFILRRA